MAIRSVKPNEPERNLELDLGTNFRTVKHSENYKTIKAELRTFCTTNK